MKAHVRDHPFRREASVHVIQAGAGYEAVLDLQARRILEWSDSPGQNYMWHSGDDKTVAELMLGHPEVREALRRRGVTDFRHIECRGANEGYFDLPEERGNRGFARSARKVEVASARWARRSRASSECWI